jgi:hypothetical protein
LLIYFYSKKFDIYYIISNEKEQDKKDLDDKKENEIKKEEKVNQKNFVEKDEDKNIIIEEKNKDNKSDIKENFINEINKKENNDKDNKILKIENDKEKDIKITQHLENNNKDHNQVNILKEKEPDFKNNKNQEKGNKINIELVKEEKNEKNNIIQLNDQISLEKENIKENEKICDQNKKENENLNFIIEDNDKIIINKDEKKEIKEIKINNIEIKEDKKELNKEKKEEKKEIKDINQIEINCLDLLKEDKKKKKEVNIDKKNPDKEKEIIKRKDKKNKKGLNNNESNDSNNNLINNEIIIQEESKNKINDNQEILDIYTEIKQINTSHNNNINEIRKKSSSSSEEENIIKINNNIDNENNVIKINNDIIDIDKPKKIEIFENYFDFHMHDIDLVQIESYYKTYKNITHEDSKIIKLLLAKYNKFISENLNQTTYPYLINSIKPNFQTLDSDLKQKYFLIQILSRKNTIKKSLFSYFKNLTKINLYGVSDKLKALFNREVIENKSFNIFSEKLSKWHCHVEMIVLYLDILSNLFNEHFDFDKKKFSLDSNFKSNTDILIKKNFYKLASKICSKISLSPGIDYYKLLTFVLTIVTTGLGGASGGLVPFAMQFSQQQVAKIVGIYGLNFLTQKASTELSSASQLQEFNALSNLVEKLNESLLKIEKTCYRLIILELQEEIYSSIETSQVDDDIKKKKDEISKLLETYLKGVECPADIEKKIEEEYVQLNASIVEQKYDNDWIIQHLRVSEVGNKDENNNNINNNKIKSDSDEDKNDKNDKDKNIFDDFVDVNKDDL